MEAFILSYTQKEFPSTSSDESRFEFEFEKDRNLHLYLHDTHPSFQLQLFKGMLFHAFKKEKAEQTDDLYEERQF